MITTALLGLGFIIGILLLCWGLTQFFGFIWIVLSNLFSSTLYNTNNYDNRQEFGGKCLIWFFVGIMIFIFCWFIGSILKL